MNYTIHRCMGIRLILKFGMTAVWNGFLLHCGGKSRITDEGNHLCDLRWFNYVWTSPKNRYQCRNQSTREDGTNLNRGKVTLCDHFHVSIFVLNSKLSIGVSMQNPSTITTI